MIDIVLKILIVGLVETGVEVLIVWWATRVPLAHEDFIRNNGEECRSYGKEVEAIIQPLLNYPIISLIVSLITIFVFGDIYWGKTDNFIFVLVLIGMYFLLTAMLTTLPVVAGQVKIKYLQSKFFDKYGVKITIAPRLRQ